MKSWHTYKDKAGLNILLTNIAYSSDKDRAHTQALLEKVPNNLELILYTDAFDATKKHEYRAVVFIDRENKKIIIANAGTRPQPNQKGMNDLRDDALLTVGKMPKKYEMISQLNNVLLQNLGQAVGEYSFHYTGHSLGGVMADIGAADMAIKMLRKGLDPRGGVSSITFDNPGAKPFVQQIYKKAGISNASIKEDVDYVAINNRKNFINTAQKQAGTVFEILMNEEKLINEKVPLSSCLNFALTAWRNLKHLVTLIPNQLKQHELSNFENVIEKGAGIVLERKPTEAHGAYFYRTGLAYNPEIFNRLKATKKKHGNLGRQLYFMTRTFQDSNGQTQKEKISFSRQEIHTALAFKHSSLQR
jgi:hypothetical protein